MTKISVAGLGLLFAVLLAGRADARLDPDPCALLSDAEVRAVQGQPPVQRLASEQPGSLFRWQQCFLRTAEFSRSVSLAVSLPLPTDERHSGPREYWRQRFHGSGTEAGEPAKKRERPPEPIEGVGEEAFWVGDPVTGAFYVLQDDVFLRLSVGGPADSAERRSRARKLALRALERLTAGSRRAARGR